MKIKFAEVNDAPIIHEIMINAFMEYRDDVPPSSALYETVESISTALEDDEQALICYGDDAPVGMVRFRLKDTGIYFYRLSVFQEKQGQGIAKYILKSLEEYANQKDLPEIVCKVRMTVAKNIKLYCSMGYSIYDEEVVYKPKGIKLKVVSMRKQL
jgi:ribosomal protein S18 acetylase RimI-like enzyme